MLSSDNASLSSHGAGGNDQECSSNVSIAAAVTNQDNLVDSSYSIANNQPDQAVENADTVTSTICGGNSSDKHLQPSTNADINICADQSQQASLISSSQCDSQILSSLPLSTQDGDRITTPPESLSKAINSIQQNISPSATSDTVENQLTQSNNSAIAHNAAFKCINAASYSSHLPNEISSTQPRSTNVLSPMTSSFTECNSNSSFPQASSIYQPVATTAALTSFPISNSLQSNNNQQHSIKQYPQQRMMSHHYPFMQISSSPNSGHSLAATSQMSCQQQQQHYPQQQYFDQQLGHQQLYSPSGNQTVQSVRAARTSSDGHSMMSLIPPPFLNDQNNNISSPRFKANVGVNSAHTSLPNTVAGSNLTVAVNTTAITNTGALQCGDAGKSLGASNPLRRPISTIDQNQIHTQLQHSSDEKNYSDINANKSANHNLKPTPPSLSSTGCSFGSNDDSTFEDGSHHVGNRQYSISDQLPGNLNNTINSGNASNFDPQFSQRAQMQSHSTSLQARRMHIAVQQHHQQQQRYMQSSLQPQLLVKTQTSQQPGQQLAHQHLSHIQHHHPHQQHQHHDFKQSMPINRAGSPTAGTRSPPFQNIIRKQSKSLLAPHQMNVLNLQLHAYRFLSRHAPLPDDYLKALNFLSATSQE
ncbi:hypothetical protein GJ496_003578 [Pomphorhynchus laevis]|nr:hypothetical protein GJ496_003578 [Pomphorhynchus laevis]